ncbi:cytochrome c oxidase subunit 1, partial [Ophidiomyces ophidiicola]
RAFPVTAVPPEIAPPANRQPPIAYCPIRRDDGFRDADCWPSNTASSARSLFDITLGRPSPLILYFPSLIPVRDHTNFAMSLHPFDPLTPDEIRLAVRVLEASFPGVPLRHKVIEVQEPIKRDTVPYLEAERLGHLLPAKPARILTALFHRMDTKVFLKALINADKKSLLQCKELPNGVQVRIF